MLPRLGGDSPTQLINMFGRYKVQFLKEAVAFEIEIELYKAVINFEYLIVIIFEILMQ